MNDMKTIKQKLFQLLLEEVSAYDYLNEILKDKQRAIVSNDLKSIEHLNGVEQMVVAKANHLTQYRTDILHDYFINDPVKDNSEMLSLFMADIPDLERAPWERTKRRLSKAALEIRTINQQNIRLISSSLEHIRGLINLFMPRDENGKHIYTNNGDENGLIGAKNLLDCNA